MTMDTIAITTINTIINKDISYYEDSYMCFNKGRTRLS